MQAKSITIIPTVTLKDQNILEKIVQEIIQKKPSILPLDLKGNIQFVESQKYQGKKDSGYVDLILKDDTKRIRYTVELMRGKLDGDHIVRLINYWDMERRQMPSWTHKAVLVVEHIEKFLNVLQTIQYSVPIIVIQMVATE